MRTTLTAVAAVAAVLCLAPAATFAVPATTRAAAPAAPQPAKPSVPPVDAARALAVEIAQRKDPARRAAALERVQALLADPDSKGRLLAMRSLQQVAELKFDHAAFGDPLRRLLTAPDEEVRALALTILPSYGGGPRDLDAIVALAADPSPRVRQAVPIAFVAANERQGGATYDALALRLLDDPDPNVRRETLRSANNIDLGPAVEARVIELSRDDRLGREAIYNALTNRPTLDVAVVDRLIELLDDPDVNVVARCASTLSRDLPPERRTAVDAAMLRVFDDSVDLNVRVNCVNALGRSTDPRVRERLGAIADDEGEADRVRDTAKRFANAGQ